MGLADYDIEYADSRPDGHFILSYVCVLNDFHYDEQFSVYLMDFIPDSDVFVTEY